MAELTQEEHESIAQKGLEAVAAAEESAGEEGTPVEADFEVEPEEKPKPEIIKRWLKVYLKPEQRETLASKMSADIMALTTTREELASIRDQYKSKITALEGEISAAARLLHAGFEMGNVECQVVRDYDFKIVNVVRMDTWETVESRRMTPDEMQRHLFREEQRSEGSDGLHGSSETEEAGN